MTTARVEKGITRYDASDTYTSGYMVRICRDGQRMSQFFSDGRHGGKRKAKRAAQERYEELCEEMGAANCRPTKDRLTHRNSSGKVGVHLVHNIDPRWKNSEYIAYCASWVSDNGSRQKITFSCTEHGEEAAFELACIARDRKTTDRAAITKLYERRLARRKPSAKMKKTRAPR